VVRYNYMKEKEEKMEECCKGKFFLRGQKCHSHNHGNPGTIYGLGFIGALIYFLQGVSGVGPVLLAIGKSIVWPALLVYKLLTVFSM
jgi:hypothetical protein